MTIFNAQIWYFYVILFLILAVLFNQFYKITTKTMRKAPALTILLQIIAGISVLIVFPFFKFRFPTDYKIYILLFIASIFYAITDRINTVVRSGIEASTYSMLRQISTVFLIIAGIILFKEAIIWTKILGATLIIFSNILVFYKKGTFKYNKYLLLGIIANITITIAMILDINISESFNLPFYVSLTLLIPAIILIIFEKIKYSDIKEEFTKGNKKAIFITSVSWGLMLVSLLRAYQLGDVSVVAPLCALTAILNVIAGYIFLKERKRLLIKIIAAILIIISVILIKI